MSIELRSRCAAGAARFAWVVGACCLVSACATVDAPAPPPSLFADHLFMPPSEAVDEAIFAPSGAMRRMVDERVAAGSTARARHQLLVDFFQPHGAIAFRYETAVTRTAAQAYESRSANCLSLTILVASLAQMMDVPVRFNQVFVDDAWTRSNGLLLASGHVNVTVGDVQDDHAIHRTAAPATVIDFLPANELKGQRSRTMSADEVVALYLNNRAAEFLDSDRLDDAYAWAKRAVERRPSSVASINTLGVVYLRRGALDEATAALDHAHGMAPRNAHVLSNLVQALERRGSPDQAKRYRELLLAVEADPPLHFFDLGVVALKSGDYRSAREHFQREVDQGVDYHEVRFALGLSQAALGDFRSARSTLAAAVQASSPGRQRDLYKAKLSLIAERLVH